MKHYWNVQCQSHEKCTTTTSIHKEIALEHKPHHDNLLHSNYKSTVLYR
jgi:hypothetical protein